MHDLNAAAAPLLALASAGFTAALPFLVPLLRKTLGWHITAAQGAIIDAAVKRGAAIGLQFLEGTDLSSVKVPASWRNLAAAHGVEYVMRRVPATLTAMGLTPAHVEEMVRAEMTLLTFVTAAPSKTLSSGIVAASVEQPPAQPASPVPTEAKV